MRVGLIQAGWDADGGNAIRYDRSAAGAADAGCDVLLLPELSDTGYVLETVPQRACTWPGPAWDALQSAAQRHGIGIIAGISERVPGGIYNAAVAFDRAGNARGGYRKMHLFRGPEGVETDIFRAGDTPQVVMLDGVCWGLSICFDLRFPQVYSQLEQRGAQVLVVLAAWPAVRIADWSVLCRARAIENQLFLVGVNHAGGGFGGRSCVIGPDGGGMCEGGEGEAGLLTADMDLSAINRVRQAMPVCVPRDNPPCAKQGKMVAGTGVEPVT